MGYSWAKQDASVGDGFTRIATEQAAKAVLNADAVGDPPADRIHSARRHCKRLRGLFRLVRADFAEYRNANALVRDAAAHLSAARDATVVRHTLERLCDWAGLPKPEPARGEAPDHGGEAAALITFRHAIGNVVKVAGDWRLDHLTVQSLGEGLERCYAQAAKARKRTIRDPNEEAFHEWRKLAKYHSFHLILLEAPLGEHAPLDIKRSEQLCVVLGEHHDLAVLAETVRKTPEKLSTDFDVEAVVRNAARQQKQLAARAHWLADEVFARPAKALRRNFEANWPTWRAESAARELA